MIKRSVIFVGLLLFFFLVIGSLLPSSLSIVKSIVINAPEERIAAEINQMENWKGWFPPLKEGTSTMQILSPAEADLLKENGGAMKLKFNYKGQDSTSFVISSPTGSVANYVFLLAKESTGIRVSLVVNTELKWYPWQKIRGVFMDKVLGPQYETALHNLKTVCEQP